MIATPREGASDEQLAAITYDDGNAYVGTGWLCPALFRYFAEAPPEIQRQRPSTITAEDGKSCGWHSPRNLL